MTDEILTPKKFKEMNIRANIESEIIAGASSVTDVVNPVPKLVLYDEAQEKFPAPTLSQLPIEQVTAAISTAVSEGISKALIAVISSPEVSQFVDGLTRSRAITDIWQGLATHDGRNALDARVLQQNAIEITHAIEAAMDHTQNRLREKGKELHDSDIHNAEKEYEEWKKNRLSKEP